MRFYFVDLAIIVTYAFSTWGDSLAKDGRISRKIATKSLFCMKFKHTLNEIN